MFKLRGCPQCHGDLHLGEDIYGRYFSCVQCGRYYAVAEDARGSGDRGVITASGPPEVPDLELVA